MKTLSIDQLQALAGEYYAPEGLYQYTKSLPFLGTLDCNVAKLIAGQWSELVVTYTVGGSGLADGAWIKGTFKFYSDWALFQTSDPAQDNYVSAEYIAGALLPGQAPATVQSLSVRFDQKGHERPFQKAVIIDVVDGYLNPGDKICVRLGDRRWGSRGTRVQTFVEDQFLLRWYIDPVGTSRFAPIKPDIAIPIVPGQPRKVKILTPRVVNPHETFRLHVHTEDEWGNATTDLENTLARVTIQKSDTSAIFSEHVLEFPANGWTVSSEEISLPDDGDYVLTCKVSGPHGLLLSSCSDYVSVSASLPMPRPLFADLHVHSDDTVGTNSTTYNFSYGQQIAGLDIIGYTANDFNVTKEAWDATLEIIKEVNDEGRLVVFPGTEWCGNSSAGGDHNVIFLDDPKNGHLEFPFDKNGNVARSFEWNEHGPAELIPGAWPLDELYATYAHAPEKHLLMPHVGGRRAILSYHHPKLERLIEIGSAWGLFEWMLRDAVQRGWKLGVSANSDEHRGRCGGGVSGTAVFGTKGGLTGVLAKELSRETVAKALRARRTFATTGERLVGILSTSDGHLQGDEISVRTDGPLTLRYSFFGSKGFSSVEAWDASGKIFHRDLQEEASASADTCARRKLRVKWGGARLYDRYREAMWRGSILVRDATISSIQPFGGISDNPEEEIKHVSTSQVSFHTHTSGDMDGVDVFFEGNGLPAGISVTGTLNGYVKVGDVLRGNPHKPQPTFSLTSHVAELRRVGGTSIQIAGGADLNVSAEILLDVELPRRVEGQLDVSATPGGKQERAVYFVGREDSGGKVITSPLFISYKSG